MKFALILKEKSTIKKWHDVSMTPCHHYQMQRKLAWIGDMYTEKKVSGICQVKLRSEDGAN